MGTGWKLESKDVRDMLDSPILGTRHCRCLGPWGHPLESTVSVQCVNDLTRKITVKFPLSLQRGKIPTYEYDDLLWDAMSVRKVEKTLEVNTSAYSNNWPQEKLRRVTAEG